MTEEKLNRRVNLLVWMDDFISREIEDPDLRKQWDNEGFHDDMEEEEIVEMAKDEDNWVNIVDTFSLILDDKWVSEKPIEKEEGDDLCE